MNLSDKPPVTYSGRQMNAIRRHKRLRYSCMVEIHTFQNTNDGMNDSMQIMVSVVGLGSTRWTVNPVASSDACEFDSRHSPQILWVDIQIGEGSGL